MSDSEHYSDFYTDGSDVSSCNDNDDSNDKSSGSDNNDNSSDISQMRCIHCEKIVSSIKDLKKHMKKSHPKTKKKFIFYQAQRINVKGNWILPNMRIARAHNWTLKYVPTALIHL